MSEPNRGTHNQRQAKSIVGYWVLVWTLLFSWFLFSAITAVYIEVKGDLNVATLIFSAFLPVAFPGSILWLFYAIFVAYRCLPIVDRYVEGAVNESFSYDIFSRMHRVIYYFSGMTSERFNAKVYPNFDFMSLHKSVQIPFKIYGYWLIVMGLAGFVAYLAKSLAVSTGALPV